MQQKVFLIHGSKPKKPIFLPSKITAELSNLFGVSNEQDELWLDDLKNYINLQSPEIEVHNFYWNGGISKKWGINPAAKNLANLINNESAENIVLFGKSHGASLIKMALKELHPDKIKKVIFVAAPHHQSESVYPKIKTTNIFSKDDKWLAFANFIIFRGKGSMALSQAKNIEFEGFDHASFNFNKKIATNSPYQSYDVYFKEILEGFESSC